MPPHTLLAALGLLLASSLTAAQQYEVSPDQLGIEDADTLQVEVSGASYRIQLPGIDAPENTMNPKLQRDMQRTGMSAAQLLPLGRAAVEGLERLLPAFRPYRLVFDPEKRDRYGRTPGDLIDAQGRPLSLRLVEEGYAIPAGPAERHSQALTDAASSAREASRGLWLSHRDAAERWAGISR